MAAAAAAATAVAVAVIAAAVVATAVAVAVAVIAVAVVATAAAVIALPVHGDGKTAAMELVTTLVRAMLTTKAAAVVAVDPPVAVGTTIPVTAVLRADLSRSSESCVFQLLSGLEQDVNISTGALGFLSQLSAPVPRTTNAFHELHKVTAEVP